MSAVPQQPPRTTLTDVKTLREQARRHIEEGAVTENYGANRDKVVELLNDALGDLVGVGLLLVRVLQELGRHGLGVDAARHEVVVPVAQHAHELGGERLVQHLDHLLAVGTVVLGDRALLDVAARLLAQGLHVGEGRAGLLLGNCAHCGLRVVPE